MYYIVMAKKKKEKQIKFITYFKYAFQSFKCLIFLKVVIFPSISFYCF